MLDDDDDDDVAGFPRLLESPGFFPKISRTWKVLENELGPGKSWKLKFNILESPGIYLWFNLKGNSTFITSGSEMICFI